MARLSRALAVGLLAAVLAIASSCGASGSRESSSTVEETIAAGGGHTCGLTSAGQVKCWGLNEAGQLGDGSRTGHATPVAVSDLEDGVVSLATGSDHTCALTDAGGVKCWGWNLYGQLGDGTKIDRPGPVDVSGLEKDVVAVTAGDTHSCALTTGGAVKCWGDNSSGQLGDNRACGSVCITPVAVSGLEGDVTAISAGRTHTWALHGAAAALC